MSTTQSSNQADAHRNAYNAAFHELGLSFHWDTERYQNVLCREGERECLRRALESLQALPDQQREALYLRTCEGLSAAEIAAVLGTSAASVKASICVARKKLREQLRDLLGSFLLLI